MISLSAGEVERRFDSLGIGNRFSLLEKQQYSTTGIVDTAEEILAFPTPEAKDGLNILRLRQLLGTDPTRQPSFFDHPWYLDEEFARQNCEPGWHILHRNPLPDSISQPLNYLSSLSQAGLELPSAIEITLMLFLHYAGTGEKLLSKKHTWCRDQASLNRFVTVGAFGRNGLFISAHPAEFASRGLGICGKVRHPWVTH